MTQEQVLVLGFNVLILDSAVIRERSWHSKVLAKIKIDDSRVGTATIAVGFGFNGSITRVSMLGLESVTATVIDLYVYWKPGFRVRLEALLSSSPSRDGNKLGSNDSMTR